MKKEEDPRSNWLNIFNENVKYSNPHSHIKKNVYFYESFSDVRP